MVERPGENLHPTDYENWLLARFDCRDGIPERLERLTNERWVTHVKTDLPKPDFTWEQYEAHVKAGFGDECFLGQDHPPTGESDDERPPGKNGDV